MRVTFFFLLSLISLQITAQNTPNNICGTSFIEDEMRNNDYLADENLQLFDLISQQVALQASQLGNVNSEANPIVVPVVFHVMYADKSDNITDDQVLQGLNVLNRDFRRRNADTVDTRPIFISVAADVNIEFKIARKTPNGSCTKGITRTQTNLAIDAGNNIKTLIHWDNKKYLNVWIVRSIKNSGGSIGTILGYAYRPNPGQHYTKDGIVIRHDALSNIGTSVRQGRTLTHEAGHYLGLKHPFDNGCFGGDNCTDTPPVASSSFGCNLNKNSCTNDNPDKPDQIENFMDYADDVCTNMLTIQQGAIMRNSLNTSNLRGYLVTSTNLQTTGIEPGMVLPCKPEAKFKTSESLICQGEFIQFTDLSFMGNPTSYNWSFPGGTPSTSTIANPLVQYNTNGAYTVTLAVSNANGSTIRTEEFSISVRPTTPVWINQFSDGFELWNVPNNNWHVETDVDTIQFFTAQNKGFNSLKSAKLNNYNIHSTRRVALITNSVSLENTKSISISFDYAYAKKISTISQDKLKIFISVDCGKTWLIKRNVVGNLLNTAPATDSPFSPAGTLQWKKGTFPLIGISFVPSLMVKFEFLTNGGGNNLYIDNVNFITTIGIEEQALGFRTLNIFPNPTSGYFNLEFDVLRDDIYSISLYDLSGREMSNILNSEKLNKGSQQFSVILESRLAQGIYLVEIKNTAGSKFEKLIIQ